MSAGRPSQEPWTLGAITTRKHPSTSGQWQARGRYRDADGERFDATASGTTEGRAKRALQAKVEEHRTTYRGGDATLNQDTTVARAGELWLEAAKRQTGTGQAAVAAHPRAVRSQPAALRPCHQHRLATARQGQQRQRHRAVAGHHRRQPRQRRRDLSASCLEQPPSHAERQGAIPASVMSRVQTPSAAVGHQGRPKVPECRL